jgi:probable F420-dependent oxidoreductase
MKIGVVYPQTEAGGDPEFLRRFALAVEEMGFVHLLAYDRVAGVQPTDRDPTLRSPYRETETFHDPLMMFSYLAGITKRIEFTTGVLVLPQRQTVLLAKQTADLDLMSGERLRLGVGVGDNYVEYEALGGNFATRGARMDEQIDLLRRLWTSALLTYEGRFHRVIRANINVRPRRQIPIWLGGFSEPAYRRGAQLGDGYIFTGALEMVEEGLRSVTRHLAVAGRSLEGFGRDVIVSRTKSAPETIDFLERWRDLGGTHATIYTGGKGLKSAQAHVDFAAEIRAKF